MICGLPGSGKTTLAKRLEAEWNALRLTPDEWMERLGCDGYDETRREVVEALQWEIAQRVLSLGVSVILESGFWVRSERDEFRARAAGIGAEAKLYFLDVTRDELAARLRRRNAALPPSTFRIEVADLDAWMDLFEPPAPDELE